MRVCFTDPPRFTALKCGLFIICFLILSNAALAAGPLLDDTVIAGWKKYEKFSRTLQGKVHFSSFSKSSNKTSSVTWEVKQNPDCALIRELRDNKDFYEIEIYNPHYHATLKQPCADPDKVELIHLDKPVTEGRPPHSVMDHFRYVDVKLSDLVSSPSFRIIKSAMETRDGRELARIEYNCVRKNKTGTENRGNGVMYLDPSRYWCLVQITEKAEQLRGGALYATGEVDTQYETIVHSSGFPLLKRCTVHSTGVIHKDNRKAGGSNHAEYDWEVGAHVPDDEFTMTAFGLPEPMGAPSPQRSHTWLWLLAAAIGVAALAILFAWLKRRQTAARAKAPMPSNRGLL